MRKNNILSFLLLAIFILNIVILVVNIEDLTPEIKELKDEDKIGYQPSFSAMWENDLLESSTNVDDQSLEKTVDQSKQTDAAPLEDSNGNSITNQNQNLHLKPPSYKIAGELGDIGIYDSAWNWTDGGSSLSVNLDSSGSNLLAIAILSFNNRNNQVSISSVTFNSDPLINLDTSEQQDDAHASIWYLKNPDTGTGLTFSLTFNDTVYYEASAWFAILDGVNQTNTFGTVAKIADPSTNDIQLAVSTTSGDSVFGAATGETTGQWTVITPSTELYHYEGPGLATCANAATGTATGSSYTMRWTAPTVDHAAAIGVGIHPAEEIIPPVINDFGVDDPGTGLPQFWANVTDVHSTVINVTLDLNGTTHDMSLNGSGYWIYQPPPVNFNDYYEYQIVNVSDSSGNYNSTGSVVKNVTFNIDNTSPDVDDWEYYDDQGPLGTFNANVSDTWGVIDTVLVDISNTSDWSGFVDIQVMRYTPGGYINDTLDETLEDQNIWFKVTVNDTSGNSFTSTAHTGSVPSLNVAPNASNLMFNPDPPTSNASLLLTYDYNDTDSDPESGTEIRWYKNGVLQAIHNDMTTVAASYLFEGDQWNVTVRPKDGQEFGIQQNSSLVTVQNSAPEVTILSVSPGSPGTTTDLTATYTYFDTDGDSQNFGNREIEWFKNGQPTAFTGLTLSSSNTAKGEDWSFKIRVHDGIQYSIWYQSANVTIINTAPTATGLNIVNAGNLKTNDDLVANWTFSDVDGDSQVAYYILWYKNSLLQPSLNNSMTITAGNTSKDQSWYFKLIVNDGTINSSVDWATALASATTQILNSPPTASSLTITTNPYTTDNLVADWSFNDDDAGDSQVSYIVRWYKDAVLQPSLNDTTNVSSSLTSKGEVWNYTLQVSDGDDYSIVYNSSSVTILNSLPTASGLTITTNPYTTTNLVADWSFNDDDAGDSQVEYIIYWYRDGAPQSNLDNKTTVEAGNTTKGETWNYTAYVYDGESWSIPYNSSTTTILNSIPTATGLNIENSGNLRTNDDLVANWTFSDVDGDSQVDFYIIWYKNGILQLSLNNSKIVNAGNTSKDQSWYFKLIVSDGTINSSVDWNTALTSSPEQILNTAPTATGVTITSNPNTTSQLEADW
ncbi:MAG: hypothetical protein ACXAEU_25545, partial [Candidatus Hodarchaeales archaeon]